MFIILSNNDLGAKPVKTFYHAYNYVVIDILTLVTRNKKIWYHTFLAGCITANCYRHITWACPSF